MSNDVDDEIDVEPSEDSEVIKHVKSSRKAFSKLATELTDSELKYSGVQKMLLAEISRLEHTVIQTEEFREKFHKVDKEKAVLLEKEKTFLFSEILYSVSLTLGAVLIGLIPSLTEHKVAIGTIGTIFILGAVIAKVVKK